MNIDPIKTAKTEKVLQGIKNLPSIPKVIFEVTKLLNNPSATTNQLAEIISKDQGLTLKILSVANSPLYGIKRKVSSIEFAILVLGFQDIKDIVTAISFVDSFKIVGQKEFNPMDFWIHSMVVGTAAKTISQSFGFNFGGDAFVAGILHDIGIMVIHKYMLPEFQTIVKTSQMTGKSILQCEYEVLGTSHQEIGKYLMDKWQLPSVLSDTVSCHHIPSRATQNVQLASIIHLADYMTQQLQVGAFYWDEGMKLDPIVSKILNFKSEEEISAFVENYREDFLVSAQSVRI